MRKLSVLLLIGMLNVGAQQASAGLGLDQPVYEPAVSVIAKNDRLSVDQAVAIAQKATGGRVLSAERVRRERRLYYRIKVLTPRGVVRIVYVDAYSGSIQ